MKGFRPKFLSSVGLATATVLALGGSAYGLYNWQTDQSLASFEAKSDQVLSQLSSLQGQLAKQTSARDSVWANLSADSSTALGWKKTFGIKDDDDLTALETRVTELLEEVEGKPVATDSFEITTASVIQPNQLPLFSNSRFANLMDHIDAIQDQLPFLDDQTTRYMKLSGDFDRYWSAKLPEIVKALAASTAASNTHASSETLKTLSTQADGLKSISEAFSSDTIQKLNGFAATISKAKIEEDAWQKAEAARLAAEAAAQSSGRRGGGRGGGGGGGGGGGCSNISYGGISGINQTGGMLALVNQARADAGLGPLVASGCLIATSCTHSAWMASTGNFSHSPWPGGRWGENIAWGFGSVGAVFTGFMNSPGHRANILRPEFNYMGTCISSSGNYWTQQFR
ncbi:MAG: CAP domain-containing protein [Cryobacterium sp.]|nr:CAP domain-containing protein [Cryobacterium sp.]